MRGILTTYSWWHYPASDASLFSHCYHWFNVFESLVWLTFAVLVFSRYARYRKSARELWYALAFLTFGLTDGLESYNMTSWLLWAKLCNLIVLLWLRARVMKRCYPTSRLY